MNLSSKLLFRLHDTGLKLAAKRFLVFLDDMKLTSSSNA